MKAREIKKKLKEDYDNHIKSYEATITERSTNIRIMRAKIRLLEMIQHDLFGVTHNYSFSEEEPEVDDVPF